MKLLPSHSPIMTAADNFNRARGFRMNIFQLQKRVRRATRRGNTFLKVLARHSGPRAVTQHSRVRAMLAHDGLRSCEQTLRVAKYYVAAFNIPVSENAFNLHG